MRIGIDARLWSETGVGRYIRNLVSELMILDQKNEYVVFLLPKDIENFKFQISNFKSSSWKIIEVEIRWHSVREQILFPKIINKEKLDLMHFPYVSVPIFYMRPFVVTIHDLIPYHFPTGKASKLPEPLYEFKSQMYRLVLHAGAARARQIIVPLKATKKDVVDTLKVSEQKVIVTYEGVDASLQKNAEITQEVKQFTKENTYFLYVGNVYPHKNVERMINAFQAFHEKNKQIKLLFVGKEDHFYKQIKKQVNGIAEIQFFHNVGDKDLSYLYSHALCLIAPSLLEGFGLPALEAMAHDCLVLASDIPPFNEVCADAALYFPPLDERALHIKMEEVYNLNSSDKGKRTALGKKRLPLFSWKHMAHQTLHIYESSISVRPNQ